ncbi:hypothetical protein [Aliagarivorans marinus]|uniref:hypothetical protein n=1 Tax=Aliagarivorans marinus TaxID=561965 RepID=UPI00040F6D53|nr:hypothetical protein [Aliagarivorans marinus]
MPIGSGFWLNDLNFNAFAVRHHLPQSCFGLHLPGSFVFSADTRPIPDLLEQLEMADELILHDVGLVGNPSHSGLEDILAHYSKPQCEQLWAYHYRSHQDAERLRHAGLQVLKPGQRLSLPAPRPLAEQLGWQLNDLPYLSLPHSQ